MTWLRISTGWRPDNLLFYKRDRGFELAGVPRTKLAGSQEERGVGWGGRDLNSDSGLNSAL